MKIFTRMSVAALAAIACGLVGCFSYHKEVTPAPVVEESSPPASTTTSSTTTTDQNGYLKKQTTTTYSNP